MATFFATGLFDSASNAITQINLHVDPSTTATDTLNNSKTEVGAIINEIKTRGTGTVSGTEIRRFTSANVQNDLQNLPTDLANQINPQITFGGSRSRSSKRTQKRRQRKQQRQNGKSKKNV